MSDPLVEWLRRMGWTVSPARADYVPYSERTGKPLDPSLVDFERRFGGRTVGHGVTAPFDISVRDAEPCPNEPEDSDRGVWLSVNEYEEYVRWVRGRGVFHGSPDEPFSPIADTAESFLAKTAFLWRCRRTCEVEVQLTEDTSLSPPPWPVDSKNPLWSTPPVLGSDTCSQLHMDEENGVYGQDHGDGKTLWFKSVDRAYTHLRSLVGRPGVHVTPLLDEQPAEISDLALLLDARDGVAFLRADQRSQSAVRLVESRATGQRVLLLTSSSESGLSMQLLTPGRRAVLRVPHFSLPITPRPPYDQPHGEGELHGEGGSLRLEEDLHKHQR